jgi:hypothetical protein
MVAPIAAKAAKDVLDNKKSSHAFDKTVKILNLVFMFLIVLALISLLLSLSIGFPFSISTSYSSTYTQKYTEKLIEEASSDKSTTNILEPFFPSGIPQDGCYLAYICPGVEPKCENETCNNCTEYAQRCKTNASCCSNCCKNMGTANSPYFECRFAEECQENCYQYNQTCSNDSQCCSGCCQKLASANYGFCKSEDECGSCVNLNETCTNSSECCSSCCKYIGNGVSKCLREDECGSCVEELGYCYNSSQCCEGLECVNGKCKETCGEYLDSCEEDSDCCSECCREWGECGFAEECCTHQNETCSSNSDCCDGLTCQNRKCLPECLDLNETCSQNNNLCCSGCCDYVAGGPGYQCLPEALCQLDCGPFGEYCKTGDDCCSGVCNADSTCGCIMGGYSCFGDNSCCSPYECISGMCNMPN